jgi:hypothetical protein
MKGFSNNDSSPRVRNLPYGVKIPFKTCPICNQEWLTRDDFLSDPKIKLLGYQVNFDELTLGAVLFNHEICFDTLGVMVKDFADLRTGPVFRERKFGSEECPLSLWPKTGRSGIMTE